MKYEIGAKIRELREKSNLSQKEFAKLIGVSNSRVSNWEQGINRPDVDILSVICEVLNVSADDLLGTRPQGTEIHTIAAHHNGEEWTDEERQAIEDFKQYVLSKRNKK